MGLLDQTGASWNRVVLWMRQLESLRQVAVEEAALRLTR